MTSISAAIIKDHREIEEYYNEVINNPSNHDHQERYGNQFVWELARHSVAEELVVYPAFEKYLGARGKEMAEHSRIQHHEVKLRLQEFQNLKPTSPEYVLNLMDLWGPLKQHMEEEETDELPELEAKIQDVKGESRTMAASFTRTKAFVPSRSHPSAGEHPPFETAMGLLTAPIDHVMDIFRKFPDHTVSPNPSTQ